MKMELHGGPALRRSAPEAGSQAASFPALGYLEGRFYRFAKRSPVPEACPLGEGLSSHMPHAPPSLLATNHCSWI